MATQTAGAEVLILGANGRIGQALCRFAPEVWRGRMRLQRRQPGAQAPQPWHVFAPLEDPEALRAVAAGCGQVLCLAGGVPGRGALEDNTRLAIAAVEAAADMGCKRVVLTSSAAVYGGAGGILREDQPLTPANPYGEAKARMEEAAQRRAAALGVAVTALRIGNVAGFDAILGGWRPGFALDQFADGRTPRRSYIGVAGLARSVCDLLDCPELPQAVNLAQPQPVEMAEILRAADLAFHLRPAPETAIAEVAFDLSLLQSCLSYPLPPAEAQSLVAQWQSFCQ